MFHDMWAKKIELTVVVVVVVDNVVLNAVVDSVVAIGVAVAAASCLSSNNCKIYFASKAEEYPPL